MNLNNLKNVQVSSIHGRDLFLPRKFDIDNDIYIFCPNKKGNGKKRI